MATCLQDIQGHIDGNTWQSLTILVPNTDNPISIDAATNELFLFQTLAFETASYELTLVASPFPGNPNVSVAFFRMNESFNGVYSIGSVACNSQFTQFQIDLSPGTYFICIRSNSGHSFTGTFRGDFTSTPFVYRFFPKSYHGEYADAALEIIELPPVCDIPVIMEMIEGSLPEGLTFANGLIDGVLPNLDCVEETKDASPSQNWSYTIDEWTTVEPWGWQWRFHVKAYLRGYPDSPIFRWFCLLVHNNWSWDKDNFMEQFPFVVPAKTRTEIPPEPLPEQLCCEEVEEEPEPTIQPIPELCPCQESDENTLRFLTWYNTYILNAEEQTEEIQEFIDNFRQSEFFKYMLQEANIEEELTFEEQEQLALNQFIAEIEANLDKYGRGSDHSDKIMLDLKDELNKTLPMTLIVLVGSTAEVDLDVN